jgi:hypothetical protein
MVETAKFFEIPRGQVIRVALHIEENPVQPPRCNVHLTVMATNYKFVDQLNQSIAEHVPLRITVHGVVAEFSIYNSTTRELDVDLHGRGRVIWPTRTMNRRPGQIVLEPTDQTFATENVIVRAWEGHTIDGEQVIALVSMVSTPAEMPSLARIPPPHPGKSNAWQIMLGEVWNDIGKLNEEELNDVRGMVRARAAYRDDSAGERICLYCNQPYRGEALYCCLRCALADG